MYIPFLLVKLVEDQLTGEHGMIAYSLVTWEDLMLKYDLLTSVVISFENINNHGLTWEE